MEQSKLNEILAQHKKWFKGKDDGEKANLRGANLRNASLSGANLDYSCLPLWCGSLQAKFDKKHYIQFLYHTLKSLENNELIDDDFKQSLLTPQNIAIANTFHRVEECGEITQKGNALIGTAIPNESK